MPFKTFGEREQVKLAYKELTKIGKVPVPAQYRMAVLARALERVKRFVYQGCVANWQASGLTDAELERVQQARTHEQVLDVIEQIEVK